MRVLAGLELGGGALSERRDGGARSGALGEVCWGPRQLLRDLELRLGLAHAPQPRALRVARYAARMAKLAPQGRYYSRSFDVDALGTAASVLELRDLLVEAGWTGQLVANGGFRLEALQELEQVADPALPAGEADRAAAVAAELERCTTRLYSEVTLIESSESWPTCFQRAFRALQRAGTRLESAEPVAPGAPEASDLGRLQRALAGSPISRPIVLSGDGSLVVTRAETSWQAAQAVAALVTTLPAETSVIVREHDASALDNALESAGARTQGLQSFSAWRSALQVLPLVLELAFEPKDPYRILELLTLPVGPFNGFVGHALARALAESPGVGSPSWEAVKQRLLHDVTPDRSAEQLARIADWLEAPAVEATAGAPIPKLLSLVDRVRSWLVSRIQIKPDDTLLLAAAQQASAMRLALESDPRPTLTLVQVRKLAQAVLERGTTASLLRERAGRIASVDSPGHLRAPRDAVVWWSFVAAPGGSRGVAWRRDELAALAAQGLRFPDAARRMMDHAAAARTAFCCAKQRLVLVIPREHAGQALSPHPLWDEPVAGARLDALALARITVNERELRAVTTLPLLERRPQLVSRAPVALPGGHAEWRVPSDHVSPIERFSPASLEALLGCPLQWVLRYRAGANSGGHALPPLHQLRGTLGHRLVELLHGSGAFQSSEVELRAQADAQLDVLFKLEGAVLLRPGMGFERAQLKRQLVEAALELRTLLHGAGLSIVAVERDVEVDWQAGILGGRLDLLVATADGQHAIIDVKAGMATYRDLLRTGTALQLAAYAFAHAASDGEGRWPEAAYFSLKQGKLFGLSSQLLPHAEVVHGPTLNDTWQRIERSVRRVLPLTGQGRFPVTGVSSAASLLEAASVPQADAPAHFELPRGARCQYCRYDALCGRRWETLQ